MQYFKGTLQNNKSNITHVFYDHVLRSPSNNIQKHILRPTEANVSDLFNKKMCRYVVVYNLR